MKRRRIKLVWRASRVINGRWYLGVFGIHQRDPGTRVKGYTVSLRGLLLWLGAAAVAAYLVLATALFLFWQQNPYNLLTFGDALLRPVRRAAVRDKQGQAFIAQGTDAMRAKRWSEGVTLLRQGLAYHPEDQRARMTLAQFYVAANQRSAALKVLQDGLADEYPGRFFLQALFAIAGQSEDFDLIARTCARYGPVLKGNTADVERRWLTAQQFAALLSAVRPGDALAVANAEAPGDTASEHRLLALLALGRPEDALALLAEWRTRPGADLGTILRLEVRACREARHFDDMERALIELRERAPTDPRALSYGVVQRALAGHTAAAEAALEDYLFRFGGSAANLQLLAEPLAEIGELALLERCAEAAVERGYPATPFQVLLVQTRLQRGDAAGAAKVLAAMQAPAGRDAADGQAQLWHEWMQRLIDAVSAPGDSAGQALLTFLHGRSWPMAIYRRNIVALQAGGRLEVAREVIAQAGGAFPASAWLAARRTEVAAALAEQAQMKAIADKIAAEVPERGAPGQIAIERIFFLQLRDLLGREQWDDAARLIREVRAVTPPPPWLGPRDGELRFAQIRIAYAGGSRAEVVAATRLYLNGDNARSEQVLAFGRQLFAKGDADTAIALTNEVLRKVPNFGPARRLLTDWQTKP